MVTSTRDAVIELIRRLPEDATLTDIMSELYAQQKIDAGVSQLDSGEGIDHEEAKKRLATWLG